MLGHRALRTIRRAYRNRVVRRRPRFEEPAGGGCDTLPAVIAYNEFGGYAIPRESLHRPAAQQAMAGRVYEKETIQLIASLCGNGDIIHAGTFFGDFLPALSQAAAPEARIWAFEPNRTSYRCADLTIRINALRNVELRHAALGQDGESARLITHDAQGRPLGGGSYICSDPEKPAKAVQATPQVRLDRCIPGDRFISVLQLDVEHYEMQALTGGLETVRRCRPWLILENVPEKTWFATHIEALGYKREPDVGGNAVFSPSSG